MMFIEVVWPKKYVKTQMLVGISKATGSTGKSPWPECLILAVN